MFQRLLPTLCRLPCSSRHITTSSVLAGRDTERPKSLSEYRSITKDRKEFMDRTMRGERAWEWTDDKRDAEYMPTLETHKLQFHGVVYDELPIAHIKATKNNTLIHFTDHMGKPITNTSARMEGFKNARKKTEVAAQTTGMAAGVRAMRRGIHSVRVTMQGLGHGRTAGPKGMALAGLNIVSITDYTNTDETFKRPKKRRRI